MAMTSASLGVATVRPPTPASELNAGDRRALVGLDVWAPGKAVVTAVGRDPLGIGPRPGEVDNAGRSFDRFQWAYGVDRHAASRSVQGMLQGLQKVGGHPPEWVRVS